MWKRYAAAAATVVGVTAAAWTMKEETVDDDRLLLARRRLQDYKECRSSAKAKAIAKTYAQIEHQSDSMKRGGKVYMEHLKQLEAGKNSEVRHRLYLEPGNTDHFYKALEDMMQKGAVDLSADFTSVFGENVECSRIVFEYECGRWLRMVRCKFCKKV